MTPITIAQAAAQSGTPRSTLNLWLRQGRIKGAVKLGNQWTLPHDWQSRMTAPKRGPKFQEPLIRPPK